MIAKYATLLVLGAGCLARAQAPVDPDKRAEAEALFQPEAGEQRLGCSFQFYKPVLNFRFRFATGYAVRIPLKQYQGGGHRLVTIVRVTPVTPAGRSQYFYANAALPPVPNRARAEADLSGGVFVGEGRYDAAVAVIDRQERVCRSEWSFEARLGNKTQHLATPVAPGTVVPLTADPWAGSLRTEQPDGERLTILLHATPLFGRLRLRNFDRSLMLSAVTAILEQTNFRQVRLVAFNLDQQRVLYESDDFTPERFEELQRALQTEDLGKIDAGALQKQRGPAAVLAGLLDAERTAERRSDAVAMIGPPTRYIGKFQTAWLREAGDKLPLFAGFEYRLFPSRGEFDDLVASAVKAVGGRLYRVHSPTEYGTAIKKFRASLQQQPDQPK